MALLPFGGRTHCLFTQRMIATIQGKAHATRGIPDGTLGGTLTGASSYAASASVEMQIVIVSGLEASDASYSVAENGSLSVNAASGLLNYNNDPYLTLSVTAINGDSTVIGSTITTSNGGSLTVNADGSFVYTPAADWTGDDTFTYTISDGVNTSTATVTIHVC
jgi:hypothetical protein